MFSGYTALSNLTKGRVKPHAVRGLLNTFCFPYQLRFIEDEARFVGWESSRQIGKSFSIGWKSIFKAASAPRRHQTILAASERQSLEVLDKVAAHCFVLEKTTGCKLLEASPSKHCITLINGSKIRALPANPRTARGFSGDLYLDEFAHVMNDRVLWEAVLPIILRADFSVTVTSTPLGDEGVFYDVMHPGDDAKHKFSRHRTTVHDAIGEGLAMKADDLAFIRASMDDDSFQQEFECAYLSVLSSMFPWALLRGAMRSDDEVLAALFKGYDLPTFIGVDIGRRKDLTSIVRGKEFPEGAVHLHASENLQNMPFEAQKNYIGRILRTENVAKCRIDATGIGANLAEDLAREFPGVVEPIAFHGNEEKNRIVVQAKIALERGAMTLPADDGAMLADFHKIKRHITPAGNIVFDAARDKTGHADRFWSGALCLDAAAVSRGWDFGVIEINTGIKKPEDAEDDHEWFGGMDAALRGGLDRAPLPEELGFLVYDDEDLEDLREGLVGGKRPPGGPAPRGDVVPFRDPMPLRCIMPDVAVLELRARGEDPCWGCDVDRRICGGRPAQKDWERPTPVPPEPLPGPRIITTDSLRDLLVSRGEVTDRCYLDGREAWNLVSGGEDPCSSCKLDRRVCGGRPAVTGDNGIRFR